MKKVFQLNIYLTNGDTPPHTVHPAVLQVEIITNIKQNKKKKSNFSQNI